MDKKKRTRKKIENETGVQEKNSNVIPFRSKEDKDDEEKKAMTRGLAYSFMSVGRKHLQEIGDEEAFGELCWLLPNGQIMVGLPLEK